MGKINLVSDIRLEKIRLKKRNYIITMSAIFVLGFMFVFILALQGYRWSRVYSLDNTKKKIANTQDELKSYKDIEDMVINIEKGTQAINEIEASQPKWSEFLPILQEVTPQDIRFTEFDQSDRKFKAKAQGKSVESIARLIKSLEDYKYKKSGIALFKNVNVEGYDNKSGFVEFEIVFEMEEGVLW